MALVDLNDSVIAQVRGAADIRVQLTRLDGQEPAVAAALVRLLQRGGLGAERAVGEDLQVAGAQPFVAQAGAQSESQGGVQIRVRNAHRDAQPQLAAVAPPLERAERSRGFEILDRGDTATMGFPLPTLDRRE